MIKKLKNEKGSAMQMAIISILLVGIFTSSVTSMVINQTKSNIKSSQNTDLKYETEEGIEESIAKFIESINVIGNKSTIEEFNVVKEYINLADILVQSNGLFNTTVNNILEKADDGTLQQSDMKLLYEQLVAAQNTTGSNQASKKMLSVAADYAKFFKENFFNEDTGELDTSGIDEGKIKNFIVEILDNLTKETFPTDPDGKKVVLFDTNNMGTIGASYFEVTFNNSAYNTTHYLNDVNNLFFGSLNITDTITNLGGLNAAKIKEIIQDIDDSDYKDNIDSEINNIKKDGYISESSLRTNYYNKISNGKIDIKKTVSQRLEIAKIEIGMLRKSLIQLLALMDGINTENDSSELEYKLIVNVPETLTDISLDNRKIRNVKLISSDVDGKSVKRTEDKTKFNVVIPGQKAQVVLYLQIESEVQDENKGNYKILSDVKVKIHKILSRDKYKVDYEIIGWNK